MDLVLCDFCEMGKVHYDEFYFPSRNLNENALNIRLCMFAFAIILLLIFTFNVALTALDLLFSVSLALRTSARSS